MTTYWTYVCIAVCCALGAVAAFLVPGLDIGVGIAIGAGVGAKQRRGDQADRQPGPERENS